MIHMNLIKGHTELIILRPGMMLANLKKPMAPDLRHVCREQGFEKALSTLEMLEANIVSVWMMWFTNGVQVNARTRRQARLIRPATRRPGRRVHATVDTGSIESDSRLSGEHHDSVVCK